VIDSEGFRANVGAVLVNSQNQVFWARRLGQSAWQFPQGGVHDGESPEQALYRELQEEVGLEKGDVKLLTCTEDWYRYRVPKQLLRKQQPEFIGQKQKWFLLELLKHDQKIRLDLSKSLEFDSWRWVDYWYPVDHVVDFKRHVYQQVLQEFHSFLFEPSK